MENEIWKDIKGYENTYQVSNLGRIRRSYNTVITSPAVVPGKILALHSNEARRSQYVGLRKNNIIRCFTIKKLVAEAFIPNILNKKYILHKDGDYHNNMVKNLFWSDSRNSRRRLLNSYNIDEIRQLHSLGNLTYKEIGSRFGVSYHTIHKVLKGKNWKHV